MRRFLLLSFFICCFSFTGWSETFKELLQKAENGDAEAQFDVAYYYCDGLSIIGTADDEVEAWKWYLKAAENGHPRAQYKVGEAYNDARLGQSYDYTKAEYWLLKAVENLDKNSVHYESALWDLVSIYDSSYKKYNRDKSIFWHKKLIDYYYYSKGTSNKFSQERLSELGVVYDPAANAPKITTVAINGANFTIKKVKDKYGLYSPNGTEIIPLECAELAHIGKTLFKFKTESDGFWGVINTNGKIVVPTTRGYTDIGKYSNLTKSISFKKIGYKGEFNLYGKQLSCIKTSTPSSTSGSSSTATAPKNNQSTNSTVVIQQPVVVPTQHQEWHPCNSCNGSGLCKYCNGNGKKWYANGYSDCAVCYGGVCNTCNGSKGAYY